MANINVDRQEALIFDGSLTFFSELKIYIDLKYIFSL